MDRRPMLQRLLRRFRHRLQRYLHYRPERRYMRG
jgi:hypothetical protein